MSSIFGHEANIEGQRYNLLNTQSGRSAMQYDANTHVHISNTYANHISQPVQDAAQ